MKTNFLNKSLISAVVLCLLMVACQAPSVPVMVQPTLTPAPLITPEVTRPPIPTGFVEYASQSGDTLNTVAAHFGVTLRDIMFEGDLDPEMLLDPGSLLLVRDILDETTPHERLIPDSDVVYSPSALGFDISTYAAHWEGFFSTYTEMMTRGTTPGHEIMYQLALEHSINPRILLTLMEYGSGWVTRQPENSDERDYPMGWIQSDRPGIYFQSGWAIRQLTQGYYGWRSGELTELVFKDKTSLRLSPHLNAGTVAVMYTLAQLYTQQEWHDALYGQQNIITVHHLLFDDPWQRAAQVEPLFPAGSAQPEMNFPFLPNQRWALTNGPHPAWGLYGARAALDFAPAGVSGCGASNRISTAAAAGLVVRSGSGVVVIDLDEDGNEQTGWVLIYNHIANRERVPVGQYLEQDDPVGYPSCEGGNATGTHLHIARKFNGEWVLADSGLPFVLSGYRAYNGLRDCKGDRFCQGYLDNSERRITADAYGNAGTITIRPDSHPKYFWTPTPKP